MDSKAAAVFLKNQFFEQASLEGVSVSGLEMQLICAFGGGVTGAEMIAEFESRHDLLVSQAKVSTVLHHAYERLREDDREKQRAWKQAAVALAGENPYLFEPWTFQPASEKFWNVGVFIRVGLSAAIAAALVAGMIVCFGLHRLP